MNSLQRSTAFGYGVLFPDTDAKGWAKRYSIEMRKLPCNDCGYEQMPDTAFAIKGYRGVCVHKPCYQCGNSQFGFTVVPVGEKRGEWEELLG